MTREERDEWGKRRMRKALSSRACDGLDATARLVMWELWSWTDDEWVARVDLDEVAVHAGLTLPEVEAAVVKLVECGLVDRRSEEEVAMLLGNRDAPR